MQVAEHSRRHGINVTRPTGPVAGVRAPPGESAKGSVEDTESVANYTTLDTTLPFTRRLPDGISYHAPSASVVCDICETRHGRRFEELMAVMVCHGDLDDVNRADVPTVHVGLPLSAGERSTLDYSDAQLVFLQVVYNAHQQRYDPTWEYDIVYDGMQHLRA